MGLLLHELYPIFDILVAHIREEAAQDPRDQVVEVDEGHEGQPEPDEHEHLLNYRVSTHSEYDVTK